MLSHLDALGNRVELNALQPPSQVLRIDQRGNEPVLAEVIGDVVKHLKTDEFTMRNGRLQAGGHVFVVPGPIESP